MANLYKRFAEPDMDFSTIALEAAYNFERHGIADSNFERNGYYQGKRIMDITAKMWIKDIENGLLTKGELYEEFPKWFIDKIIPRDTFIEDKEARLGIVNSVRRRKND